MQVKTRTVLLIVGAVATAIFVVNLFSSADTRYKEEVFEQRVKKARFLEFSPQSPFVIAKKAFKPLVFFEPDPRFKVQAEFEDYPQPILIDLSISHEGKPKAYKVVGLLKFKLNINGRPQDLMLQALVGKNQNNEWDEANLFVPFKDLTSGDQTYGGGRYIDIPFKGQSYLELDFNLAYNPWCAYVPQFACPLPPDGNSLPVAVLAGEKFNE